MPAPVEDEDPDIAYGQHRHRPAPRYGGRDGYAPPDAVARERMRDAATKLRPARLPRAARALAQRRAPRAQWRLVTPAELGVLAHVPGDPARYGFDTAALHRPYPGGTPYPVPVRPGHTGPGWTRGGWTATPPDNDPYDDGPPTDEGWAGRVAARTALTDHR